MDEREIIGVRYLNAEGQAVGKLYPYYSTISANVNDVIKVPAGPGTVWAKVVGVNISEADISPQVKPYMKCITRDCGIIRFVKDEVKG